jgi:hypothetical protein
VVWWRLVGAHGDLFGWASSEKQSLPVKSSNNYGMSLLIDCEVVGSVFNSDDEISLSLSKKLKN